MKKLNEKIWHCSTCGCYKYGDVPEPCDDNSRISLRCGPWKAIGNKRIVEPSSNIIEGEFKKEKSFPVKVKHKYKDTEMLLTPPEDINEQTLYVFDEERLNYSSEEIKEKEEFTKCVKYEKPKGYGYYNYPWGDV